VAVRIDSTEVTPRRDRAPELAFSIERVEPVRYATVPTLGFGVRIERVSGPPVRSIALNAQIRIAATRRAYDPETQERLIELFGGPEIWGRGLRSLPWTSAVGQVPSFDNSIVVELAVACTYDFEVAASKYLHALRDGEVPLELLFSGTVFYAGEDLGLQIVLVPWEKEAEYRMPIRVWRQMMDHYFPNSAWLRLRRDSFDRLYAYRSRNALPSWERTVDALLDEAEEG
jgi:Family of unknown function (DUF6084)